MILSGVRYRETLMRFARGVAMAAIGFMVARLHLHVFDQWFLKWGSLEKFGESK